jgi:iron complex outermembrane recepter protein
MTFVATKVRPGAGLLLPILLSVLLSAVRLHALPGDTELSGVVRDPSSNVIAGAAITLVNVVTGVTRTAASDRTGQYRMADLSSGTYHVRIEFPGFELYSRDITLDERGARSLDVTLKLASRKESLTVASTSPSATPFGGIPRPVDISDQARSLNTAQLLANVPGASLRDNGALATIPILHGLDDERVRVVTNGMFVSPSCPNHMNPPLSYVDPSAVGQLRVMAGITPVSIGGDSIAGTIVVDSPQPVFAAPAERTHAEGVFATFFRSNGQGYGPSLNASISNATFSLGYGGTWTNNNNYRDGHGDLVTSSYSQNTNQVVTLAARTSGNLFGLQVGFQNTPYEGFSNQQMDMVSNRSEFINFSFRRNVGAGLLDARVFWRNVGLEMNIGKDKSTFPMAMFMPMDSHTHDLGYTVKWAAPLSDRHTIQVGSDFQRSALNSTWPAVPDTAPTTGPDPFVSMNDGRRSRIGLFAEANSQWTAHWTTLLGLRADTVRTNTGPVSGYSDMYAMDAEAFNALNRARTDFDVDVTAVARYAPNTSSTFEMGYARKVRAPNLYERYAWSTDFMTSGMINWFGDGNAYVGNVNLRPEVAHTISGTASWHDGSHQDWEIAVTPYETFVQDYIDVDQLATQVYEMSTLSQLMFANHDARIWGIDVNGAATIWKSEKYGRGALTGMGGWLHGRRLDSGSGLYQMMPLNARIGLKEIYKGFSAGPDIQLVDRKRDTDPLRFEQPTPGYALVNFTAGYQWRHLRLEGGGSNLLNKWYYLPLGGVNFDNFLASGWMSQITPLTGAGRSFYVGMSVPF